jgi:malic enzyme
LIIVILNVAHTQNQINNSLGFPGIFRGTLDVRARTITDEMCFVAAQALADQIADRLDEDHDLTRTMMRAGLIRNPPET